MQNEKQNNKTNIESTESSGLITSTEKVDNSIKNIDPTINNSDNNSDNNIEKNKLIWTVQIEELLRKWGDISVCYKWLHDQSYRKYRNKNYLYAIPIVILSTLTGVLNVGLSGYVPSEYTSLGQASIGGVNILTGILTTLQNFFKYAELSESHLNAAQGWSKLNRNIIVELNLEVEYRSDAERFLRDCRRDYDRLIEQSPPINRDVIDRFKKNFKNIKDLIVPDIIDNITHTNVYRKEEPIDEKIIPIEKEEIKVINVDDLKDILVEDHIHHHPSFHQNNHRRHSFIHNNNNYNNNNNIKLDNRRSLEKNKDKEILNKGEQNAEKPIIDIPSNRPKIKDLIKKFTDTESIFEEKKKTLLDRIEDIQTIEDKKINNLETKPDNESEFILNKSSINLNTVNENEDNNNNQNINNLKPLNPFYSFTPSLFINSKLKNIQSIKKEENSTTLNNSNNNDENLN